MGWTEQEARGKRQWVRDDDNAVISLRETATGDWAVTLDRLAQAPEGEDYARETVASRDEALALVETWQREYGTATGGS
ncbi:hypothetical protein ACFQH6_07455 [Halobacteriaceae archaeon GCM10025711]